MGDELLDRVLREIRERKQAAQAAVEESARLERALAALEQTAGEAGTPGQEGRRRSGRGPRARPRAAPDANRAAVLAVVGERPGATAGEVGEATGIARATVSSTLARLVEAGALERVELPSGGVGFRARSDATAASTARETEDAAPAAAAESSD